MDQQSVPLPPVPVTTPHTLPQATELLKSSWQYYKAHFRRLLTITLVSWIVIAGATIIAGLMGATANQAHALAPTFSVALLIYVIIIITAGCWQYVALIYAVTPGEGETKNWQDVYKTSKRWLWTYLLAAIITGVLTMIGFVLLFIPGIVIAVWFSLASYIVVNENLSAIPALKASRNYVRGKFSQVLGRWALLILVAIGLSIVMGMVGGIFGDSVKNLINLVFTLFVTPFIAIYGSKLYQAVKSSPA